MKILDLLGLTELVDLCKQTFANITHTHKLEDITDYTVDSSLSSTSTNPVQNKVVNNALVTIAEDMDKIDADINKINDEKADKTELPTKVSQLENDSNYATNEDVTTALNNKLTHHTDVEDVHMTDERKTQLTDAYTHSKDTNVHVTSEEKAQLLSHKDDVGNPHQILEKIEANSDLVVTELGDEIVGDSPELDPVVESRISEIETEVSSLKSDLNEEVTARQNAVATETAERKAEIAVERERINQFIALGEGSTTGDAELIDARVDNDGNTHDCVGDAIRYQSGKTKAILDYHNINTDTVAFIQGYIDFYGDERESETRARTDYIVGRRKLTILNSTEYSFNIHAYNDSKEHIWTNNEYLSDDVVEIDATDYSYLKLCARKVDNTNLDAKDVKPIFVFDSDDGLGDKWKNRIKNIEDTVESLVLSVPNYWEERIDSICANYLSEIGTNGQFKIPFIWLSDSHITANNGMYEKLIDYVCEKTGINTIMQCGDTLDESEHDTGMTRWIGYNKALAKTGRDYLSCFGNHDCNAWASALYDSGKSSWYIDWGTLFITGMLPYDSNKVYGNGNYYYFDIPSRKIRFISLDCYDRLQKWNDDGTYMYTNSKVSDEQIQFIESALTGIPSGYKVILFGHEPIIDLSWNGGRGVTMDNVSALTTMLNNYTDIILCYFCGHVHYDDVNTVNGLTQITILNDGTNIHDMSETGLPNANEKISGTTNEQAIDIVVIDSVNKVVKTFRIGEGSDRTIEL